MILARLEQADRYLALHPDFAAAIAFLRGQPLNDLPRGGSRLPGPCTPWFPGHPLANDPKPAWKHIASTSTSNT